ncbi:tyrosine-type recombinase/integrase [Denitromonas ohlonensis]|uniref:Tyrosine-type recombinase/integrase n=2 Tax=Denitromonas TaxID=139331 RepID=A0A557S4D5_9RHOO|nr:site-specific integrase [Denitromonas ohlonensis]TVO60548.1 tyrosine-type recombinase/integrase [Denitromonas ohlonensis]TVO72278.1 tyrosine-type recombinase/integrase [Denitromonas ohlonensis]
MAETINFTKAKLDALPLPSKGLRDEYCDAKQPSLRLRVTSTGVKTFCVLKRIRDGGMNRITLARYPEMTIEQARRKTAETIGKIAEGGNPGEVRKALRSELTFRELFGEFAERHGKKKRAWAADLQRYRAYLDRPLGARRLSEITPAMVSRILSDTEQAGKANATINNIRALASTIFAKGIEWGYAETNPVSATKARKKVSRDRFFQADELPRFFAALMAEANDTVRDYFLVSLLTGARRANVLAMRWGEINFSDRVWRISHTKNGDPQNVPLGDEVMAVLGRRQSAVGAGTEFVFPGQGGSSGHLVEPKKGWKRIFDRDEISMLTIMIAETGRTFGPKCNAKTGGEVFESLEARVQRAREMAKGLGIKIDGVRIHDVRIHDLRRTLGSWQAKTGASLPIIGKSLNHKSPQATAIYARLDLDPVRASVEKATAAMLKAGGVVDFCGASTD